MRNPYKIESLLIDFNVSVIMPFYKKYLNSRKYFH